MPSAEYYTSSEDQGTLSPQAPSKSAGIPYVSVSNGDVVVMRRKSSVGNLSSLDSVSQTKPNDLAAMPTSLDDTFDSGEAAFEYIIDRSQTASIAHEGTSFYLRLGFLREFIKYLILLSESWN